MNASVVNFAGRRILPSLALSVGILLASCTSAETQQRTVIIRGEITIQSADQDVTDSSGINLSIVSTRSESTEDTILDVNTDIDGRFSVVVSVDERGSYPLVISRNNQVLYLSNLVLAPGDTINLSGSVPGLSDNIKVESRENNAMATYERLQRLYGRVATYAYGGGLAQDTIPGLMNQWSDYFWSLRQEYPGTYASEMGSIDAIEVLEGWNDTKTLERINELDNSSTFLPVKVIYGGHVTARLNGLDSGLAYLDNLRSQTRDVNEQMTMDMRKIELLNDFSEYDRALTEINKMLQRRNNDEEFNTWAQSVKYELENLIPGRVIPDFSVPLNPSTTLSKASSAGKYTMIEVVLLADANYQAVYPQLLEIYRNAGIDNLNFYTLPLDNSQITIDAFFEEREKSWTFSNAGSLDQGNILDTLKIDQVPTRFLIGPDGKIISRYISHDISGIAADLQAIVQN
jgi:hypothetical protein